MTRIAALVVVVVAVLASFVQGQARGPNIVLFIADDMSVLDSSAYGNRQIPGPNMLALSEECHACLRRG